MAPKLDSLILQDLVEPSSYLVQEFWLLTCRFPRAIHDVTRSNWGVMKGFANADCSPFSFLLNFGLVVERVFLQHGGPRVIEPGLCPMTRRHLRVQMIVGQRVEELLLMDVHRLVSHSGLPWKTGQRDHSFKNAWDIFWLKARHP